MISFIFLAVLLAIGLAHGLRVEKRRNVPHTEIMLTYVVAGYCGAYMLVAGAVDLVASFGGTTIFPFGNPSIAAQRFFDVALLGLATIALMSPWYRGRYLAAPVAGWSLFWCGATYIHLTDLSAAGNLTLWTATEIFASHTSVAVTMCVLLVLARRAPGAGVKHSLG